MILMAQTQELCISLRNEGLYYWQETRMKYDSVVAIIGWATILERTREL